MNSVNMIGRLARDPELRKTEDGKSICNFPIAIDDIFSKDDRADFIRVTVFGNQGDNCMKYLKKGLLAGVSGRLRADSYTDSEGVKRYPISVTADRVQFLSWGDKSSTKPQVKQDSSLVTSEEVIAESSQDLIEATTPEGDTGATPETEIDSTPETPAETDDEKAPEDGSAPGREITIEIIPDTRLI